MHYALCSPFTTLPEPPLSIAAGEMVFPWMFDDFVELQPVKEAAQILAEKSDWPHLYDLDVLQKNKAPIAAACYYDDM